MTSVWVERASGLASGSGGRRVRHFDGHAHEFVDLTNHPMLTVVAGRSVNVVIETNQGPDETPMSDKPPYRVPLMAEVRELPWNGFNVISTFAGCGGSSTGYRMAGFKVLLANEFVEAARDSYAANARPGTIIDGRDIRTVKPEDILAATGLKAGELDVFDGSPPCASFSTAGKREKGWGTTKTYSDTEQRSDDLFFEYARLIRGLQPRVFVAENVSGLVKGTAKGYFLEILAALKACGYRVSARLLDAQWLGVPQARQRLIFVGVRNDLGMEPVHPAPLPYRYSIREAIPWITKAVHDTSGQWSTGEVTDRPSPTITAGVGTINSCHFKVSGEPVIRQGSWASHSDRRGEEVSLDEPAPTVVAGSADRGRTDQFVIQAPQGHYRDDKGGARRLVIDPEIPAPTVMAGGVGNVNTGQYRIDTSGEPSGPPPASAGTVEPDQDLDISRYAIGKKWREIGPGGHVFYGTGLHRPDTEGPSPTITATGGADGASGVTHPTECRKFTIAELRRICGFPDDFVLKGTYQQQWERLGRAVPPVMMSHVAAAVRDQILIPLREKGAI